ncbi:MAG TPA: prenyltransferase/squalene oxidase repeat-containing protein [Gemmataceae bacterium]|nr:prenyltransferase/squalene oxidase repeat-containing protein [Gemmataceae bacterium]
MSANNSKPKNQAPVVVLREEPSNLGRYLFLFVPAVIGSVVFHGILLGLFFGFLLIGSGPAEETKIEKREEQFVEAEKVEEKKETFSVVDVDPSAQEFDTDIQYMNDRIAEVSVPGSNNPNEAVGIVDGDKSAQPVNLPAPGGFGGTGQGGALESFSGPGNSMAVGEIGGYGPRGMPLQGTFYGRSGATREYALRSGGGTDASEAAVARGLKWLVRQQMSDGRWMLNSPNLPDKDRGTESNDIAGTALGLLPFLAAGKTHLPSSKTKNKAPNEYDKVVDKGLKFLIRSQDKQSGYFGSSMYAHGLATIAMCEAYGLSQDPILRRPAQMGINLLVNTQHERGGWRYGASKQEGDLSVTGWQIMALKSGMMSGLDVPTITVKRAKNFLQGTCNEKTEGYCYLEDRQNPTYRMTAVGLLCRQYLENWGPSHPRMIKSIQTYIKSHPPTIQDVYYYYYATQVMHHFGGEEWKNWNEAMREQLIKKQDGNNNSAHFGSWSPAGDQWGRAGGRLMITSLNLLTLEVYYRYLPLYYRDAGYKMDAAVQKAS